MRNPGVHTGTSLVALSRAIAPIVIGAACFVGAATPAQGQSLCVPLLGLGNVCVPPSGTAGTPAPLAPVSALGPVVATLDGGARGATTLDLTSLGTAADVTLTTLGGTAITTLDRPGVLINSAGTVTAQVDSIATSGDGATGALLRAVDRVVFTADDIVSTLGAAAPALDVEGGTISVDGDVFETAGADSPGVELISLTGPITLDADAIRTDGDRSTAALLRSAGNVGVNVGVLRTQGSQALGLDIGTNPATCVLLGNGGCDVTAAADSITTGGFGGIGALVSAATGLTTIDVDVLQTGGDEAAGLSLATDAAVCAVLGAGACDQRFSVGTLATQGARSPGALVRAAGTITGSVNLLTTDGEDAVGLDLASAPDACVVLGRGNCGASFTLGQLTTSGAGATGVLARIVGPTTGRVTLLETLGDNAAGIDLAADPTACALLGAGACDVDLAADRVTTRGDGAAAVLIDAPARVIANIGSILTTGTGATGLGIVTDPTICLVLGPGSCGISAVVGPVETGGDGATGVDVDGGGDPVDVSTGPVTTGGDGAGGVEVDNDGPTTVETGPVTTGGDDAPGVDVGGGSGPTTVTTGPVTTGGDNSPGVVVDGEGPITVGTGPVTTGGDASSGVVVDGGDGPIVVGTGPIATAGDDSPGIDVSGNGPITVVAGPIDTGGDRSPAIDVDGGAGPVAVSAGAITTDGAAASGIDVATTTGGQTIVAGPIAVTGPGSNGIVATGSGCAAIDVVARGPISAAQGSGIVASSACGVSVATLPGAPVNGAVGGIVVTSGTGSVVTIGDRVSGGSAVDANGAGTSLTVASTGTLVGRVDLTESDDRLVNLGRIEAAGTSAFGGGADTLANAGTLALAQATVPARVGFTGLERFENSGSIDLRNGRTGDLLALSGDYVGTGASTIGLDVAIGAGATSADTVTIGGAATGSTTIALNPLGGQPGVLVDGLVLVDAGAGSSAGAFTLGGVPATAGLVGYSLAFDPANATYALYGTPTDAAYQLVKAIEGARQVFYRGGEAWSGHMRSLRDAGAADEGRRRGSALWGQMYGSLSRTRDSQDVAAFGQVRSVRLDRKQDVYGGQIGYDLGGIGEREGSVFGVTGGYANSTLDFRGSAGRLRYEAANVGLYAGLVAGPAFVNLIGRYERLWARAVLPGAGIRQRFDGHTLGGKAEAGLRLGGERFYAEPSVSVDYARTSLDTLDLSPTTIDFDRATGLRGSAGLRLGSTIGSGPARTTVYLSGQAVREFEGRAGFDFVNNGQTIGVRNDRPGTFGRATAGINVVSGARVSGFIEVNGEAGDGYRSGGGRAGLSVRF